MRLHDPLSRSCSERSSSPARLLGRAGLAQLPRDLARPSYDVTTLDPAIVHLGVGGFHRAHQAVYLDRLAEADPALGWSVTGVGLRSSRSRSDLLAQDCLYTVVERDESAESARVVGILRDYLSAREDPAAALGALTDARTRLVTLTVTAPTYAEESPAAEVFDLVARALADRRTRGLAPFTVVSCDNLPRNGDSSRTRVVAAAELLEPGLAGWVEQHVAFPNSMVDRITPPTTTRDHQRLRQRYGVHDRALVVTEPFSQWVVEDVFSAGRPAWEEVGVEMTTDVGPYVELKTRMLNASHVALGFLSRSTEHRTTDQAMLDPQLRRLVRRMMTHEVAPLLAPVPGLTHTAYRDTVLARLTNPAIADPLDRLRRRGSVRVANYVVPSIEAAVERRRPHAMLDDVVAAWVSHLAETAAAVDAGSLSRADALEELADPGAERLLALAPLAARDVRPLLAATPGFERLLDCPTFVAPLQRRLTDHQESSRATAS